MGIIQHFFFFFFFLKSFQSYGRRFVWSSNWNKWIAIITVAIVYAIELYCINFHMVNVSSFFFFLVGKGKRSRIWWHCYAMLWKYVHTTLFTWNLMHQRNFENLHNYCRSHSIALRRTFYCSVIFSFSKRYIFTSTSEHHRSWHMCVCYHTAVGSWTIFW